MFHWICPECGREIPPAVKECPACDPASVVQAAAPEPSPLAAIPEPLAASPLETPLETPLEAPLEPAPEPEPLAVVPLEATPLREPPPPDPAPLREPPPLPEPLLRLAQKLREAQRDLELAAANTEVSANIARPEPAPEPPPPSQPEPVAVGPTARALHPQMLLLASAPAAIGLLAPPEPEPAPQPERQWEPELELNLEPLPEVAGPAAAGRVPTPDPALGPAPAAPPPLPIPAELAVPPSAPSGATLSQSVLIAVSAPASPMLALAPLQDASSLARRIRPAAPPTQIQRPDAGPRMTLPGPALPAALNSLQDAGLSKILVDRSKGAAKRSHGWLSSVLAAAVLLAVFLGVELFNAPRTAADPQPTPPSEAAPATSPVPAVSTPASAAVSTAASYSLSKAIEVTGFRFVGENKPEVRYLVVNHSAAELGAVTVYVTLRSSAAKSGQLPLYRFSFRAPALGPFESKEMAATLDKPARSGADWQSLHADIELGQ